jgi:hypothetical protein
LSPRSASTQSSQTIGIGATSLDIGLRNFLSSIAAGMLLLLVIYLYHPSILNSSTPYVPVLYLLISVPIGFLTNGVGYFSLGWIVRAIEGQLLQRRFICSNLMMVQDWDEVVSFFALDRLRGKARQWLLFRYGCEGYMKRCQPELYKHYEFIVGIEILSRNVSLLAILSLLYSYYSGVYILDRVHDSVIGWSVAILFISISSLESLYVGLKSIDDVFVVANYGYGLLVDDKSSWVDLLKELYRRDLVRPRTDAVSD